MDKAIADPDMKERRGIARELPKTRGRCQMCFGHDRELRMLFIGDFIGWACEECRRQLRESVERQFCATMEHTEPGE
jgi:hypothetical protein